jgi:hypothetical protein
MLKQILLFTLYIFFLTFGNAQTTNSYFPTDGKCGQWLKAGPEEIYKNEELYSLINGGADVYFEYGFQKVFVQSFENNKMEKINVEIYQMTSDTAAFGIFTNNCSKKGESVDIGWLSQKTDYSLVCWWGNYFILIRSNQKSLAINEGICLIAENIIFQLPACKRNSNFQSLFPTKVPLGFYRYHRGNISLGTILNFPEIDILAHCQVVSYMVNDSIFIRFFYINPSDASAYFIHIKDQFAKSPKYTSFNAEENNFTITDKRNRQVSFSITDRIIEIIVGK